MPAPSSRSVAAVLVLAVLVLTAGCNGLDTGQSRTTAGTVSPAPVPTTSPTATPVPTVAPGVERNGRVRAAAVVDRHRRALATHSYTVTIRRTVTVVNGSAGGSAAIDANATGTNRTGGEGATRRETYVRAWVGVNRSHYRLVQFVNVSRPGRVTTASEPAVDLWFNGSAAFYRVTDSTGTPYVRARGVESETLSDPTFPLLLREFFAVARFRPADRARAGGSIRFVAAGVNRSAVDPPPPYERPRNVTAEFVLTSAGIVRATRLTYTATGEGERVRVRERTTIANVDETTVPIPPWVPENGRQVQE